MNGCESPPTFLAKPLWGIRDGPRIAGSWASARSRIEYSRSSGTRDHVVLETAIAMSRNMHREVKRLSDHMYPSVNPRVSDDVDSGETLRQCMTLSVPGDAISQ